MGAREVEGLGRVMGVSQQKMTLHTQRYIVYMGTWEVLATTDNRV